ncbi:MAG: 30S ribosome-binding factor RbfA [Anaerolineaceae bacterium]|nr:30S ribosome-binding factor RbfA [Anaerolineaceae bacterium]
MPSKLRTKRIADRIKELLSEMLVTGKISDPRLASVFITDVTVDRELSFANIFVSSLKGKSKSDEILAGLKHARGYLRSSLAREIDLRTFPVLRFLWDETPERAERIEQLLDSISETRLADENQEN